MTFTAFGAAWVVTFAQLLAGGVHPERNVALHRALIAQGYVVVPLTRYNHDCGFEVCVGLEGQSARLILDTGAYYTSIVPALAARCKLPAGGGVKLRSVHGESDATRHTVHQFVVGTVRSDFVSAVSEPAMVKLLDGVRADDGTPLEGVLGHDFLDHYAAVIDYGSAELYLQPPAVREQPQLAGQWKCVAAACEGKPCSPADIAGTCVEWAGGRVVVTTPGEAQTFHIRYLPEYEPKRLILYKLAGDKADGRPVESCQAYYKIEGDNLELCLKSDGRTATPWDEIPQDFKPKPKSGWTYFRFHRDKPKK